MKAELAQAMYLSFTTDIWTTDVSSNSLLNLTAHWLTDSFERKSAVLHAQSFPGSRTGENIAKIFDAMFKEWSIEKEQVHLIVRDNAANMVKAMKDGGYADLGCFTHTLQLIVHEGVLPQRLVKDTVAVCRKIAGHFKHSPLAYSKLKDIQRSLSLPLHHFKHDEPTRWNSTLYMLMGVQEQKMALGAYSSDPSHNITQLTANQLDIVSKTILALDPIEQITKSISTEQASASGQITKSISTEQASASGQITKSISTEQASASEQITKSISTEQASASGQITKSISTEQASASEQITKSISTEQASASGQITKSISTEQASASLIIPFIRALRKTLENHENDKVRQA